MQTAEFDWDRLIEAQANVINCSDCRRCSGSDPNSPQPSYVGPNYRRGGLAIVLQNPGSPPRNWENEIRETRLKEVLARFRAEASIENYHLVVSEIHRQMTGEAPTRPAWPSWVHPVKKCVEGLASPSEFAWLNIVKHRTPGEIETNRATRTAEETHGLRAHLATELEVLRPGAVLAIGASPARALAQVSGNWKLITVGQRARDEDAYRVRNQLKGVVLSKQ